MKSDENWTAKKVIECIRNRFSEKDKYVVLENVPNGTGWSCDGWVDAVVFSLWPSLGCRRLALEVKISRADFLRELQNPEKNAWVRGVCHEFAYVTPNGVAKEEELPEGIGLYVCSGDSIKVIRAPAAKTDMKVDDITMAGFVRAMQKEMNRQAEAVAQDVFANDHRAKEAFFWQASATAFLHKHGISVPFRLTPDKEGIETLQLLESATASKATEHDRDQLVQQTEKFRKAVCDAFVNFVQFAQVGILETDKMGDFILEEYKDIGLKEALSRWQESKKKKTDKIADLIMD